MLELDPKLFAKEAISEETAAFIAEMEAIFDKLPATHEVPVELTRKAREEGRGIFPSGGPLPGSDWREINAGTGRVRVSLPEGAPKGVYLHIHGGGWTLGSPKFSDAQNQLLAAETGAAVISIEYRLAPEHPWPAAHDDCVGAAIWALETLPPNYRPDAWLPPQVVWEVRGAMLSASPVFRAAADLVDENGKGIALRFPRFLRTRDDKAPTDATTSAQLAHLFLAQQSAVAAAAAAPREPPPPPPPPGPIER